jgi:hypothetical protein
MLVLLVMDPYASAKPPSAPVNVEFSVPDNVKLGDEVTTVLTFRALADLDRLDVSMAPFKGLELLSEPKEATFTNVRKGEGRQVTVRIRLTAEPFGYLSVRYQTRQGVKSSGGATMVIYGSVS